MRTLTVPLTEQDHKLLAIPQKVEDVEDEGEAALVAAMVPLALAAVMVPLALVAVMVPLALVAVAMATNMIRHFAALVVAGCTAEVVPTIAPGVAVLSLSMK